MKLILDRFNTRSNLLCMNSSATGWRGPKAPDSQEPTHVPRRARWKGAEGPLPSSYCNYNINSYIAHIIAEMIEIVLIILHSYIAHITQEIVEIELLHSYVSSLYYDSNACIYHIYWIII